MTSSPLSSDQNAPRHLESNLAVDVGQCTSAGIKTSNEDAIGIRIPVGGALATKGVVGIVADGVSAAEAGKEASDTAVTSFISDYYSTHDTWSVKTSGLKVLLALNRWLYGRGQNELKTDRGFVTTFSAIILKSSSAYIFHVGDSRVYRLRGGKLEQLTRDHATPVGNGQTYLSRALGIDSKLEVDFHTVDLLPEDTFLMTTDGVHDWLSTREIEKLCNESTDWGATSEQLVAMASKAGSDDNLSAQLIHIKSTGSVQATDILQQLSDLPFIPALKLGERIDGWQVIKELHASSRSEVYLVEQNDGEQAVLKIPSPNFQDDPAYIERFIMEEWIGTRIHSPNVVSVLRARDRSFLYYLTEYAQGPTLAQLLKERTRLSVPDARNIIIQVASGLRAFHRKDSLHQDIKPDNIIYTENGVKIIDFGSTRIAGVSEMDSGIQREELLGTIEYCAPEYRLGTAVSAQSDQFSLGILLYVLVTGKHPFDGAYLRAKTRKDFQELKYVPAYSVSPLVPVWIDGAIARTLHLDPALRYESLSEFVQDLKVPNQKYTHQSKAPLLDRNPLLFWKSIAGCLLLLNIILLLAISIRP